MQLLILFIQAYFAYYATMHIGVFAKLYIYDGILKRPCQHIKYRLNTSLRNYKNYMPSKGG